VLYLPVSWTDDAHRCAEAGVPTEVGFATKPQVAQVMIERVVTAGLPFGWVAADESYGDNPGLRHWLESRQIRYVMAVSCDHAVPTAAGPVRADTLATDPALVWQRMSCGDGAKGPRWYGFAVVATTSHAHRLVVRRHVSTGELAYFWAHTPTGPRWPSWCGSSGCGGWLRSASRRPRGRSGSTTIRCGPGRAGTGTSPWRWPRTAG
jgi:SRSO17 transposase